MGPAGVQPPEADGEYMSGWTAGALAAVCFAAVIAVIVLLVWWF
jgi:hypothetical protein